MLEVLARIRHRRTRRQLSSYLDGMLSVHESRRLQAHLAQCQACRDELAELQATVQTLAELPLVESPRSFALTAAPRRVGGPAAGGSTTGVRAAPGHRGGRLRSGRRRGGRSGGSAGRRRRAEGHEPNLMRMEAAPTEAGPLTAEAQMPEAEDKAATEAPTAAGSRHSWLSDRRWRRLRRGWVVREERDADVGGSCPAAERPARVCAGDPSRPRLRPPQRLRPPPRPRPPQRLRPPPAAPRRRRRRWRRRPCRRKRRARGDAVRRHRRVHVAPRRKRMGRSLVLRHDGGDHPRPERAGRPRPGGTWPASTRAGARRRDHRSSADRRQHRSQRDRRAASFRG